MDVFTLARVVLRRWYVVVLMLMATAVGAYVMLQTAEPTYETTGSAILTHASMFGEPPDEAASSEDGGEGAQAGLLSAEVLATAMSSSAVSDEVAQAGGTQPFEVIAREGAQLQIVSTGDSAGGVVATVEAAMEILAEQHARLQDQLGIPDRQRSTIVVLWTSDEAVAAANAEDEDEAQSSRAYQAEGWAGLIQPSAETANPYGPNSMTLRILGEVMNAADAYVEVVGADSSATFQLHFEPRDVAPLLTITTTASDPHEALGVFTRTLEVANERLAELQAASGAPEAGFLVLEPLRLPAEAIRTSSPLTRPVVGILGLGLLASVSLAVLTDNLLTRRGADGTTRNARRETWPDWLLTGDQDEDDVPGRPSVPAGRPAERRWGLSDDR